MKSNSPASIRILIGKFGLLGLALALALAALAACGGSAGDTTPAAVEPSVTADAPPAAQVAPPFALPNAAGETVSLASYAGRSNVVLIFYRGFW